MSQQSGQSSLDALDFQDAGAPPQQHMLQPPMHMQQQQVPQSSAIAPTFSGNDFHGPGSMPVLSDATVDDEEIVEKSNPTIEFLGWHLDVDSTVIMLSSIAIWVLIWYKSGLFDVLPKDNSLYMILFGFFILYSIINMVTSGSKSGSVLYELNILLTVEQMVAILFGTVIVFTLFNDKLQIHQDQKSVITRVSVSIMILLSFASLWLNVITSGRAFRAIRKGKQALYNISYCLFIVIGLLAFNSSTTLTDVRKLLTTTPLTTPLGPLLPAAPRV